MIFVSVGTHEQGFERLVKEMDRLADKLGEEVFIQTGYSKYVCLHCQSAHMLGYNDMIKKVQNCRIYITHGGPGSMLLGFQYGKIPIVVPRQKEMHEHVDNHQVVFVQRIEAAGKVLAVYEIKQLHGVISNYSRLVDKLPRTGFETRGADDLIKNLDKYCSSLI